jgi:hypothetical protein
VRFPVLARGDEGRAERLEPLQLIPPFDHRLRTPKDKGRAGNATRFADIVGQAALRLWSDLPRDIQERLFEEAVAAADALRHEVALYLHDHHPRTAHPPKPTARAL